MAQRMRTQEPMEWTPPTMNSILDDEPGSQITQRWESPQSTALKASFFEELLRARRIPSACRGAVATVLRDVGATTAKRFSATVVAARAQMAVVRTSVAMDPLEHFDAVTNGVERYNQHHLPLCGIFAEAVVIRDGTWIEAPQTCPYDRLRFRVSAGMRDRAFDAWCTARQAEHWDVSMRTVETPRGQMRTARAIDPTRALIIRVTPNRVSVDWTPAKSLWGRNDWTYRVTEAHLRHGLRTIFDDLLIVPVTEADGYELTAVDICKDLIGPIRLIRDTYALAQLPGRHQRHDLESDYLRFGSRRSDHLVLYGKDLEMYFHHHPEIPELPHNQRVRIEFRTRLAKNRLLVAMLSSPDARGIPIRLPRSRTHGPVEGRLDFGAGHVVLHTMLEALEGNEEVGWGQRPALRKSLEFAQHPFIRQIQMCKTWTSVARQRRLERFESRRKGRRNRQHRAQMLERFKRDERRRRRAYARRCEAKAFQAAKIATGLRLASLAYPFTLAQHMAAWMTEGRRAHHADREAILRSEEEDGQSVHFSKMEDRK